MHSVKTSAAMDAPWQALWENGRGEKDFIGSPVQRIACPIFRTLDGRASTAPAAAWQALWEDGNNEKSDVIDHPHQEVVEFIISTRVANTDIECLDVRWRLDYNGEGEDGWLERTTNGEVLTVPPSSATQASQQVSHVQKGTIYGNQNESNPVFQGMSLKDLDCSSDFLFNCLLDSRNMQDINILQCGENPFHCAITRAFREIICANIVLCAVERWEAMDPLKWIMELDKLNRLYTASVIKPWGPLAEYLTCRPYGNLDELEKLVRAADRAADEELWQLLRLKSVKHGEFQRRLEWAVKVLRMRIATNPFDLRILKAY